MRWRTVFLIYLLSNPIAPVYAHFLLITGRAVCPGNRRIENVPLVLFLNPSFQFANKRAPTVAVGHDDDAVAFHAVRHHVALESPVGAAVHEVPAFASFLDLESDGERPNPDRGYHLLHHGFRQNTVGLPEEGLLDLNDEFPEIRRRGP